MPGADGVVDSWVRGAVVAGGVVLAEEVGLDLGVDAAQPLPVDLVEVVGLEDEGADDAGARGSPGDDGDGAEEDVLVGAHGRGLVGLCDDEVGAIGIVGDGSASRGGKEVAGALGEVDLEGGAEGRVIWAGWRGEFSSC